MTNIKNNNNNPLPYDNELMKAAQSGCLELVKMHINNGQDINSHTADGNCALFIAAKNGYADIVEFLIKNGVDLKGMLSSDSVRLAAKNGHVKTVKLLLEAGVRYQCSLSEHFFKKYKPEVENLLLCYSPLQSKEVSAQSAFVAAFLGTTIFAALLISGQGLSSFILAIIAVTLAVFVLDFIFMKLISDDNKKSEEFCLKNNLITQEQLNKLRPDMTVKVKSNITKVPVAEIVSEGYIKYVLPESGVYAPGSENYVGNVKKHF